MTEPLYSERRARVLVQVVERWHPGDDSDETALAAVSAADEAYRHGMNDLEWEAATLDNLKTGGKL